MLGAPPPPFPLLEPEEEELLEDEELEDDEEEELELEELLDELELLDEEDELELLEEELLLEEPLLEDDEACILTVATVALAAPMAFFTRTPCRPRERVTVAVRLLAPEVVLNATSASSTKSERRPLPVVVQARLTA